MLKISKYVHVRSSFAWDFACMYVSFIYAYESWMYIYVWYKKIDFYMEFILVL